MHRPNQFAARTGFTLIELMIVIVIIVLLVGLLLPALNSAREKAADQATRGYLTSIGVACESYQLTFGVYPGYFSDRDFETNAPWLFQVLTGNENLVISLLGRVVTNPPDTNPPYWKLLGNNKYPSSFKYKIFDLDNIGTGPMDESGAVYAPFYNPKPGQLGIFQGNSDVNLPKAEENPIPEFVDNSGVPLLYCRVNPAGDRPIGDRESNFPNGQITRGQLGLIYFGTDQMIPAGGGSSIDQKNNSVLTTEVTGTIGEPWLSNPAWIYGSSRFSNYTEGTSTSAPTMNETDDTIGAGFVLSAAGRDNIYFSKDQLGKKVINSFEDVVKFDDIVIRGGVQ